MNQVAINHIVDRVRRLFGGSPCPLQVAALPWRRKDGRVQVMLITTRESGRWILPKGWPEAGEELYHAAAREAQEEAGLDGVVAATEAGRYFYAKAVGGETLRYEVLVYPLEVNNVASKWKEKGQRSRKWVTPTKAAGMVTEPELSQIIAAFGDSVEKIV